MYAIAFDMDIAKLKTNFGTPYNNAYVEIGEILEKHGFSWTQGSVYLSNKDTDGVGMVFDAMNALKEINWFTKSVRDIRAFKVEDWSDFTERLKK